MPLDGIDKPNAAERLGLRVGWVVLMVVAGLALGLMAASWFGGWGE